MSSSPLRRVAYRSLSKITGVTAVNDGLNAFRGNVLLYSHDYEMINTVANRMIAILPDRIIDYRGTYEEFLETYGNVMDAARVSFEKEDI